MNWFRTDNTLLSEVVSALAWLEAREASVTIKNGQASVQIFEQMGGMRVRKAEGVGDCLLEAINDAAHIIKSQDSSSSDS
jgi:hypothetical protein